MSDLFLRTKAGRVHRGALTDAGIVLVAEACNLDQSEAEEVLSAIPESAEWQDFCERCFPRFEDSGDPAGVAPV